MMMITARIRGIWCFSIFCMTGKSMKLIITANTMGAKTAAVDLRKNMPTTINTRTKSVENALFFLLNLLIFIQIVSITYFIQCVNISKDNNYSARRIE